MRNRVFIEIILKWVLFLLLPQISFAGEALQWDKPQRVGVYEAGPIIRKAFPGWCLSPKVFHESDESGEVYFRDGEPTPKGIKIGDYTLLVAPTLRQNSPNKYAWMVGLLKMGEKVLWSQGAANPFNWDLAKSGNSAILEKAGNTIGIKIIDLEGNRIYRETWQRPNPVGWRRLAFVNGHPIFSFSPTGRWLVSSKEALDSDGAIAAQTILVFDCVTLEKWEKSVDGLHVFDARFASDNKVRLFQKPLRKEGQVNPLSPGKKHKSVVLNLETKQLENKEE